MVGQPDHVCAMTWPARILAHEGSLFIRWLGLLSEIGNPYCIGFEPQCLDTELTVI